LAQEVIDGLWHKCMTVVRGHDAGGERHSNCRHYSISRS
jgi:hypothetical protein